MPREVFLDFDPFAVASLNEKKIAAPGSPAKTLLSELKLQGIIENARQICKVLLQSFVFLGVKRNQLKSIDHHCPILDNLA